MLQTIKDNDYNLKSYFSVSVERIYFIQVNQERVVEMIYKASRRLKGYGLTRGSLVLVQRGVVQF
jgi:hypothetical protein